MSEEELREDLGVLNVVNFGGGSYVLYAEINEEAGEIEVDPEPYSDNFDRPARLLPVEAKALVAAIDLIGEHIPEGSLTSARKKIVAALGEDPMEQGLQVAPPAGDDSDVARTISKAITGRRLIELEYTRRTRTRSRPQGRALRPDQRPRGLVRRLLRPRTRRRAAFPPRPHQERDVSDERSSRGRRSTRQPRSTAGCAPARSRLRAARASGSPPSAPAGRARRGASSRSARRAGDRRAQLRRRRLAGPRDPPRKPATPPCSSRRTPARPCGRPWRGCARRTPRSPASSAWSAAPGCRSPRECGGSRGCAAATRRAARARAGGPRSASVARCRRLGRAPASTPRRRPRSSRRLRPARRRRRSPAWRSPL